MNTPTLYEYIHQNQRLTFIDAANGNTYSPVDFHDTLDLHLPKTLAFLYVDNRIGSVAAFINFLRSSHVLVLLNHHLHDTLKLQLETNYQPGYIYDPGRKSVKGYQMQKENLYVRSVQVNHLLHPDLKYLLSTSGSTGSPKLVKLSERNIVANALSILDYLPIHPQDVVPLNLSLSYAYGLSVFTTHAIAGGKILCTDKDILQKEFWDDFHHYGCTSLAGVPFSYELLHKIRFCDSVYPSLRYLTQAGGKLSDALMKKFGHYAHTHNLSFFIMYGQTEATARMAYLSPHDLLRKPGSIGKPILQGAFSIDPEKGELLYKGPNVFGGYAHTSQDLQEYHTPEVLHTGDIACVDDEGYYYIQGRLKRFIKLSGHRINLDEIETLLTSALGNTGVTCHGIDDKRLHIVHCVPLIKEATVKQLLAQTCHIHPHQVRISFMESLPVTINGKRDYQAIEAALC